jgi:enediyne biosynthesis protein E4
VSETSRPFEARADGSAAVAPRLLLAACAALAACSHEDGASPTSGGKPSDAFGGTSTGLPTAAAPAPVPDPAALFTDWTAESGLTFTQYCGATGNFNYPETMAGGGALFDADGDGDLDLFLVNGCSFPPRANDPTHQLWKNDGHGHFTEATKGSGLGVVHRGMASVVADVDIDGDPDLLVTGVGRTLLFLNRGDGTFEDHSDRAGIQTGRWSSAAVLFDYDGDGILDLALGHYVLWSEAIERKNDSEHRCVYQHGNRDYCPVADYAADTLSLFKGRGDGSFEEVTAKAGLAGAKCKALGMLVCDVDQDGRPDLLVTNDTLPTQLFQNRGDGTFVDIGFESGLALDAWGHSYAGMGVAADYDGDGALSLAIGNFTGEPVTFHRQKRDEHGALVCEFDELSAKNGLRGPTLKMVTWGTLFLDYDRDGDCDLLVANGHIGRQQELEGIPYAQPTQLFRRDGEAFTPIALPEGGLGRPVVGRGLAGGDLDGDGDVDLLLLENQGRARLFRNDCGGSGGSLRVTLRGAARTPANGAAVTGSNRDGIGARVRVKAAGRVQEKRRVCGDGYFAANEPALTFGLGQAAQADEVEVLWPSGTRDLFTKVPAGATLLVAEGSTGAAPLAKSAALAATQPYTSRPLAELEALARTRADDLPLQKALAIKALSEPRLDVAARALERAAELAPDDPIVAWQQLRLLALQGDLAKMRARLKELFDRFGFDVMTLNAWYYLSQAGAETAAAALLDEALARRPDSASLRYRKAAAAMDSRRNDEALAEFARAVALDPEYWRANVAIATIKFGAGDAAGAAAAARAALAKEPGALEAMRLLAQALHLLHQDGEVTKPFEARLKAAPDDLPVRAELVLILESLERKDELEQQLGELARRHPADPRAWRAILDARLDGTNAAQLGSAAMQAAAACGDDPDVLVRCARAAIKLHQPVEAARGFVERALRRDPQHAEALALEAKLAR